ncbi:MAG: HAD-IC family P-type ATPase [Flavobacteriia bacterium]|nr:HAD-IC family P-type ATPase [Flavobacteriia bacterium]
MVADGKSFCCNGCKTVYEIFSSSDLTCYYDLQNAPGAIPKEMEGKYDFLDNASIAEKLLEFNDGTTQIITLYIPHIHCSSCIWILENLNKLNKSIKASQVVFPKKTVRLHFNAKEISLKEVVILLGSIGYEPYISLDDYASAKKPIDRSLIYKLGIAGFAFGNVMFLSFPEYFEMNEFWLEQYKPLFRWLMFSFALPVFFYSASGYFISAFKGLRAKVLNIDVPIAVGIIVLFARSTYEIIFDHGAGFFDSLTGLVFFLLLGKYFQQKTYNFLSFERDFKSYFPIAVTRITSGRKEESVQVYDVKKGDRLLIRNQELIPVDCILIKGNALIDYSFVTGESDPIQKQSGDKVFAGGKQISGAIEVETLKSVSQSYLTQLWSNDAFSKDKELAFTTLTNTISKYFTIVILTIALVSTTYWFFVNQALAMQVFTAVLIIACPCALAMSAPFTLGNTLRIFGKLKFYLKNATVIEQLSKIDTVIFDKTGTITATTKNSIYYDGIPLTQKEEGLLKNALRASNHPLSRMLYTLLKEQDSITPDVFKEYSGKGILAKWNGDQIKIGSANYVDNKGVQSKSEEKRTSIHISINNCYKGKYIFKNNYRKGVENVFKELEKQYNLAILSGDNEGEKAYLHQKLPKKTTLLFHQKPEDKLAYIQDLQNYGHTILMVGDGLNDAGALKQSNVGIAISENVNVFSPACDAILDASKLAELPSYLNMTKKAIGIIKTSMVISFLYNIVGLYFAVTGQLAPVVAAIIMPLSSISVVVFTTVATNIMGRNLK